MQIFFGRPVDLVVASVIRNPYFREAVERQFEIIGEALEQLARLDEALAAQISEYRRINAFRNILIHGHAQVDHRLVWSIVETKLPVLHLDVQKLLEER